MSIGNYNGKFRKLVNRIAEKDIGKHFDDETLVEYYIRGLKKKIQKKVL